MTPRRSAASAPPAVWTESVGLLPHRVIVEEIPSRRGGLYLRWWNPARGNWEKRSLGSVRLGKVLRDERGYIVDEVAQWAVQQATRQYLILTGGVPAETAAKARPLAIGDAWPAISDPERGKYPHRTEFRDEIQRALKFAETVWGKERAWETIGEEDWSMLARRRMTELVARRHVGVRGSEKDVSRLITVVRWLRKTKRIPAGAAEWPDGWKADLIAFWKGLTKTGRDPQPNRPRFEHDIALKILAVTWDVDPRFGLLMDLGAELRLGQVARCRRADLDLEHRTLRVIGAGRKGGTMIDLTDGQVSSAQRALDGYLADRETAWQAESKDYDLFPGGKLRRVYRVKAPRVTTGKSSSRPVAGNTIRKWFREAEELVKLDDGSSLKHVNGRGAYGIRRIHVDVANKEGISRLGLRAAGGWSSTKIPDEIYSEQENRLGRAEAKKVRAIFRKEGQP